MKDNVGIFGGFSVKNGAILWSQRDWLQHLAILSGEIQQDANPTNNSKNIIRNDGNGLSSTAILDGFVLEFAYSQAYGGALYNSNADPTIRNCTFQNNYSDHGGAVNIIYSSAYIYNCRFLNNTALYTGGAISANNCDGIFSNCLFVDNEAGFNGGAITSADDASTYLNCTFTGNEVVGNYPWVKGGALHLGPSGGNIYVQNCIIWGNDVINGTTGVNVFIEGTATDVKCQYNLIEGSGGSSSWDPLFGQDDGNNIDVNPKFTVTYQLDPAAPKSPAIDAGNTALVSLAKDLNNEQRVMNVSVDMGAFELQCGAIFVDEYATTGANTGLDWDNAFTDLQSALAAARQSQGCARDIWVSAGTYDPSSVDPTEFASYEMVPGVGIYGGFDAQNGQRSWIDRDWVNNVTILTGNTPAGHHVYNVIRNDNVGLSNDAILDGFTIKEAISYNAPGIQQGAFHCIGDESPTVRNCIFEENFAHMGAAITLMGGQPVIQDCIIRFNTAEDNAGGFYGWYTDAIITNCLFHNNTSTEGQGAAMAIVTSTVAIANCTFANNDALNANYGGGIHVNGYSTVTIDNSILWGNTAQNPEYNSINSGISSPSTPPAPHIYATTIKNSIVENTINSADQWLNKANDGGGNLDIDPIFLNSSSDFRLRSNSPGIDAGDNGLIAGDTTDLIGNIRIYDSIVDMGCYEFDGTSLV
jgi:predicted outer membrane repeat protein